MSAVKWLSPEPNAVLVSGDKLVATWSTPARPIFSPSFQLCLVETEECGDTVWPKVKKLPNGQYTITLKIPQLGSDNNFFVRMVDDKGSNYDTPEFKLQGSGPPRSALALNSGSSSSSSVLPDSLAPILPDSGSSGSNSSLSKSNEEIKGSPQNSNEGTDRTAFKNAGKGWASQANGTSTMSVSGNSTTVPATTAISSLALTPSITNNALIGNSNDNKPSTAAIVVPLAIFAAALAGLLFSLRQRSKAKEIQGPNNEPALNQVTSGDLSTGGSSKSIAGSSPTDLERAMEFIAVIRASQSPQLTPLPPSIESRWRERRKNRMQQSDASFRTGVSSNHTSIPASLSMPDMNQQIRPHNGPLPPIPSVVELDPTDMCPQHEIPRSGTYPTVPNHTSGLSRTAAHQVLASALAAEPAHSPTHPFGLIPGSHPDLAQAIPAIPTTRLPASLSFAGMPRPPCFVQPPAPAIPLSISQPSITTDLIHHSTSATSAPALNSTLSPLFVLPDSLRAALPRPLTASVPEIVISTGHSRCLEPQAQPQLEYKPAEQSPTRPRPAIPYSTRPRARDPQVTAVPNPYEAIAKALRTPRLV
ncbi:hypothetical protein OPQ81_006894 [Rhizoctonia solani]|nr:hypothetical protein OPQ81_006894 [Rhizoctonia solani]